MHRHREGGGSGLSRARVWASFCDDCDDSTPMRTLWHLMLPRFLRTVRSRQLSTRSLVLLGGVAMLLFACMAMYGLELEHSVPDHEDLHGLAPEQASFVGLHSSDDVIDEDGAGRQQGRRVEGAPFANGPHPSHSAMPPQVRIDEHGLFKYVLLEVAGVGSSQNHPSESFQTQSALLVRGSARFNFHQQNVMEAQKELAAMGLPPYAHALQWALSLLLSLIRRRPTLAHIPKCHSVLSNQCTQPDGVHDKLPSNALMVEISRAAVDPLC